MSKTPIWVFGLSCAFVVYAILLYPLLLKVLARFARKPVQERDSLPTVAVIIPVHNAGELMHRALESVLRLDYPRELLDVLVVSDGSTDETDDIVREYAAWDVRLLHMAQGGRAAALNAGIPWIRSSIVVVTDVKQVLEKESLREMMKYFADPEVGVVSGEVSLQAIDDNPEERIYGLHQAFKSWMQDRLSDIDSMLGASGRFYGIRRMIFEEIPADVLLDDSHVALSAFFRGYRVVAQPQARAYEDPKPLKTTFGKKVRALAGEYELLRHDGGLLTARNRMRFHAFSLALSRILMPFALIAIAVTSFRLPTHKMVITAVAIQAVCYGLAIVDSWVPTRSWFKRLSAAARLFVATAIAALCALPALFLPAKKLFRSEA